MQQHCAQGFKQGEPPCLNKRDVEMNIMQTETSFRQRRALVLPSQHEVVSSLAVFHSRPNVGFSNELRRLVSLYGAHEVARHLSNELVANPLSSRSNERVVRARSLLMSSFGDLNDSRFLDLMAKHGLGSNNLRVRRSTLLAFGRMGEKARPVLKQIRAAERSLNPFIRETARDAALRVTLDLQAKAVVPKGVTALAIRPKKKWFTSLRSGSA